MKQHITVEQLQELTVDQKELLREWWKPQLGDWCVYDNRAKLIIDTHEEYVTETMILKSYLSDLAECELDTAVYPLLSIGQMIEIMHARNSSFGNHYIDFSWDGELCDALWGEVKQIL